MAGASSDISEEMIELSFLECFQITIFLRYSFVTTSSVFCFLFFFFKVQSKIGVRIIHGCALYTVAHYTRVNTVVPRHVANLKKYFSAKKSYNMQCCRAFASMCIVNAT